MLSTPAEDSIAADRSAAADQAFGHHLRQARREAGLTQNELGGPAFSGSYVSLIESGRRTATEAFVDHVRSTLSLTAEQTEAWLNTGQDLGSRLTDLLTRSRQLQADRDWSQAETLAAEGARLADDLGQPLTWWTFIESRLMCLRRMEEYTAMAELTEDLLAQPRVLDQDSTLTFVLLNATAAHRVLGQHDDALATARRAVAVAEKTTDGSTPLLQARRAVVAALTAAGHLSEALEECLTLERAISPHEIRESGLTLWAKGNIQFSKGDVSAGVESHDRAFQLLGDAPIGTELWHRFLRASAQFRLQHRTLEGSTAVVVETAAQGLASLYTPSALAEADFLTGCLAALQGHQETARTLLEPAVAESSSLDDGERGLAAELLAVCADGDDQNRLLLQAARSFSAAGLHDQVARVLAQIQD